MKLLKAIGVLILLILPVFIFKVPEYVELNDLAIIRGVGLSCQGEKVTLTLKEIIPIKGENGITYQYEYYQGESKDISGAYRKILDKTKKKLYLSKVKFLVTNCCGPANAGPQHKRDCRQRRGSPFFRSRADYSPNSPAGRGMSSRGSFSQEKRGSSSSGQAGAGSGSRPPR